MKTKEMRIIKAYEDEKIYRMVSKGEELLGEEVIHVERGANLKLLLVHTFQESEEVKSSLSIVQEEDSHVQVVSIYLGEAQYKQKMDVQLKGRGAKCEVKSGYLIHKDSIYSMNYDVWHEGRRTVSNIVVKGALLDYARKNFDGNLYFKRGAKGANGSEVEDALLLSSKAVSHAIPALWCDEEEVMGNHASTSGKLSKEKMFYLMSRGLSEEDAKYLMVEAELRPILDEIDDVALRQELLECIQRRMRP